MSIASPYFEQMLSQIYSTEIQLRQIPLIWTCPCPKFHLKFMMNWMILNFEIVNFPFLDGDVPRYSSHGVYISQIIRFARVNVDDFNNRNRFFDC